MEQPTFCASELTERAEGSLFSNKALTLHLQSLGYPENSIESMLKCGLPVGEYLRHCDCSSKIVVSRHKCNLRTCPRCSLKRKARLRHDYFDLLSSLPQDKTFFLYFLTISPQNYDSLDEGLKSIKKNFAKFLRHDYIKERIKGGIYVIESKDKNKFGESNGWNVHIHCLCYGRFLDNRIRGKCFKCGQNLIKFDYDSKKYYCANRKCNSLQVLFKQDSKIVSLWKQSSKENVNFNITRLKSTSFGLNYLLKYISANKDDFKDVNSLAQYIFSTRKLRLISRFGLFSYSKKIIDGKTVICKFIIPKKKYKCKLCNSEIDYFNDYKVIDSYKDSLEKQRSCCFFQTKHLNI